MKISRGRGCIGSLSRIQCNGAPPSRLLVSKRPLGSTTSQPPSGMETSVASHFPELESHSLVVPSVLPVRAQCPSGENATELTPVGMPFQAPDFGARRHLPQPRGFVPTACQ